MSILTVKATDGQRGVLTEYHPPEAEKSAKYPPEVEKSAKYPLWGWKIGKIPPPEVGSKDPPFWILAKIHQKSCKIAKKKLREIVKFSDISSKQPKNRGILCKKDTFLETLTSKFWKFSWKMAFYPKYHCFWVFFDRKSQNSPQKAV